jgi:outer membrane protein assembly factor BamD
MTLTNRMSRATTKHFPTALGLALVGVLALPGCLFYRHRKSDLATQVNPGDQPDKILYEKASNEITHGRYDVGRLTLQTLINTYPDSEFLAKAKLAIADSYYSEGGVSGLTQAEQEYKDFITFFPTAPEAPEAQYRVGLSHFRLMAKADRDQTEAKLAEAEFKEFLLKYPDNPLMPRVKARLRETQEVLAEGDYKTASFYMMRRAYPAARSRFQEIVEKYPNYSHGDEALFNLGLNLEYLKKYQLAAPYYARVLTDFPLSPRAQDAKARLIALHQPIPRPTRAVLARAQADALRHHRLDLFGKLSGMMSSAPDTSATLRGPVHLGGPQPGEAVMAKTAPTAPQPGKGTLVAQPLSDESLNSGKAIDPKPSGTTSAEDPNVKVQQSSTDSGNQNPSGIQTPRKKKKGHFHLLKKLSPF